MEDGLQNNLKRFSQIMLDMRSCGFATEKPLCCDYLVLPPFHRGNPFSNFAQIEVIQISPNRAHSDISCIKLQKAGESKLS